MAEVIQIEEEDDPNMVIVTPIAPHRYCMDGWLKNNLDLLKRDVVKHDYDGFIIIDGGEGEGKTTLAGQVALYLDPTYNIDRCCFTADEFLRAVDNATKFQAIVFDEAHGYLNTRQALSKFNRELIKAMAEMRFKNLFVIINIPSFFMLDWYPAVHRSIGLLHVYKRGCFAFYNRKQKFALYMYGKKYHAYTIKPCFIGPFVKHFVLDKDEYNKKKLSIVLKPQKESKPLKEAMPDPSAIAERNPDNVWES